MSLQIHNSLTRQKAELVPITPGRVGMYVCGMTVYDYCHIGHARVLVVFDMIARYLRHSGLDVHYVRNITDIDDKIIQRASDNGEPFEHLTGRFIDAMHADSAALGVLPPDEEPRATAHVGEIVTMVQQLVEGGHAYASPNGDVYFDVSGWADYGQLSNRSPDEMRAGARVDVNEAKDDPLDFVLWKAAKPSEPSWPSPWGDGRPGWHIECSAMSTHCLGSHFDIHGGGADLLFPHHENEIAQSCASTGDDFVNVWIHNGFVRVDDEKMSKSLGNFFTIREVLERYQPEVLRYFILSSHYRSPLNYSDAALDNARAALTRYYTALDLAGEQEGAAVPTEDDYVVRFQSAMDDDFNTPEALAVLADLTRALNRAESAERIGLALRLRQLGGVLGLLQQSPRAFLQGDETGHAEDDVDIDELVRQRNAARAAKAWGEADRIRDLLAERNILLEDSGGETRWRRG
ncbi:MAG: cysteine--tRNA ligase [Gammaproteobacteria bacterium]|nr:cysteine--tRNA ligase [Gammaproteobacteria bacterium]